MLNNLTIMGRLTADPEIKSVGAKGSRVANFRIAVESDYKDANGNRKTIFVDCQAWGPGADYIGKYFRKGRMMVIQGRLDMNEWEKDGQKHSRVIVVVDNAYFGDSKKDDGQSAPAGSYGGAGAGYGAPAAGYGAPAAPGYGAPAAPAPGYGAPAAPAPGYGAPAAPAPGYGGGYSAPQGGYAPPQGYAPQGGYASPGGQNGNFAVLNDDDAQLPF